MSMWSRIKLRFQWSSITVMAISALLLIFLNGLMQGGSYARSRGVPFAWFWFRDTGPPFEGYSMFAFLADVMVAVACVISIGWISEWVRHPRFRWLTVSTLLIATLLSAWLIFASHFSDGHGRRGIPLNWEHWVPNTSIHFYDWFALIGDALLCFLGICGIVWAVEALIASRIRNQKYEDRNKEPSA